MPSGVYFRAGVGLLIVNGDGLVFAAERSDIPEAWQAPQGGLLPFEEPIEAARRELLEETGIPWSDVVVLSEYPDWVAYELPGDHRSTKTGRGQVQKWFLLRYTGDGHAIEVSSGDGSEFAQWTWLPFEQLVDRAWDVRKHIYRQLADAWGRYLD